MRTWRLQIFCAVLAVPWGLWGAIGCALNNPARDLKGLYPDMTSYREDVREMVKHPSGKELYTDLKARVGGDLDPVYESFETPYTFYSVFKEGELIGYVHGVNVAGRGGVIQLFLALDPESATIRKMAFQRLESLGSRAIRALKVREQFEGLNLGDFYKNDYFVVAEPDSPNDKVGMIKSPEKLPQAAVEDWAAVLRGVRKNLILVDFLIKERRYEPFYTHAQKMLREQESRTEEKK